MDWLTGKGVDPLWHHQYHCSEFTHLPFRSTVDGVWWAEDGQWLLNYHNICSISQLAIHRTWSLGWTWVDHQPTEDGSRDHNCGTDECSWHVIQQVHYFFVFINRFLFFRSITTTLDLLLYQTTTSLLAYRSGACPRLQLLSLNRSCQNYYYSYTI